LACRPLPHRGVVLLQQCGPSSLMFRCNTHQRCGVDSSSSDDRAGRSASKRLQSGQSEARVHGMVLLLRFTSVACDPGERRFFNRRIITAVILQYLPPRPPRGNTALDLMAAGRAPLALEYEVAQAKLPPGVLGRQIQMDCLWSVPRWSAAAKGPMNAFRMWLHIIQWQEGRRSPVPPHSPSGSVAACYFGRTVLTRPVAAMSACVVIHEDLGPGNADGDGGETTSSGNAASPREGSTSEVH
jgi:hypothetical protein